MTTTPDRHAKAATALKRVIDMRRAHGASGISIGYRLAHILRDAGLTAPMFHGINVLLGQHELPAGTDPEPTRSMVSMAAKHRHHADHSTTVATS